MINENTDERWGVYLGNLLMLTSLQDLMMMDKTCSVREDFICTNMVIHFKV